jgi:hypothetical protein
MRNTNAATATPALHCLADGVGTDHSLRHFRHRDLHRAPPLSWGVVAVQHRLRRCHLLGDASTLMMASGEFGRKECGLSPGCVDGGPRRPARARGTAAESSREPSHLGRCRDEARPHHEKDSRYSRDGEPDVSVARDLPPTRCPAYAGGGLCCRHGRAKLAERHAHVVFTLGDHSCDAIALVASGGMLAQTAVGQLFDR